MNEIKQELIYMGGGNWVLEWQVDVDKFYRISDDMFVIGRAPIAGRDDSDLYANETYWEVGALTTDIPKDTLLDFVTSDVLMIYLQMKEEWLKADRTIKVEPKTNKPIGMYLDTEENELLSVAQLEKEYEELKANNDTEAETFDQYISNCIDANLKAVSVETNIYTTDDGEHTIIWKDVIVDNDPFTTEIVGWYFGAPNDEDTNMYDSNMKAEY